MVGKFFAWLLTKGYFVRRVLRQESWTLVWIQDEQGHPRAGGTRVVIDILQGRKGRGKKFPFWIWELGGRVAKRVHSEKGARGYNWVIVIYFQRWHKINTYQTGCTIRTSRGWLVGSKGQVPLPFL